jgi:hypothetical protein
MRSRMARISNISQKGYDITVINSGNGTGDATCATNTLLMKKNQLTPKIQSVVIKASRAIRRRNRSTVGIRNRPTKTSG